MWCIGIVSTSLAAIVSIQSVVASAHDSALLRAARYAASGAIPIVGTTVASALGTLGGGLAFVKSSIGAASIAVVLLIALSPLLTLLLYRLSFSFCSLLLEFCATPEGVRCFSAFKSALDVLIAVYSASVLVCVVQLVVFLKGGVAP
jgi:stage III sporulation protein AE